MSSNCDVEGPKSDGRQCESGQKECSFPPIRWEFFFRKKTKTKRGLTCKQWCSCIWNIVWIMTVNVPTVCSGQSTGWWKEPKCSHTSHMTTFTSPIGKMHLWNYFTRSDGGRTTFSLQANCSRGFFLKAYRNQHLKEVSLMCSAFGAHLPKQTAPTGKTNPRLIQPN